MVLLKSRGFLVLVSSCIALCLTSFWTPKECLGGMTMSPSKIVLNVPVKGVYQDVQAVIRQPMEAGYILLTDNDTFSMSLSLECLGIDGDTYWEVGPEAFALRYCYVDDNFLVSFDRLEVQQFLEEKYITCRPSGGLQPVEVAGTYTAVYYDDEVKVLVSGIPLSGTDLIEVLDPGMEDPGKGK
jgi:hypothetical protein